jgi:hypothetical protein
VAFHVSGSPARRRRRSADASPEANRTKGAYVFINERGQPFGRMGIGRMIERAGEAAGVPFPHAAAFDGICTAGQRNGHTTAPAFLGPRRDHEYRLLHGDVARAVQGYWR